MRPMLKLLGQWCSWSVERGGRDLVSDAGMKAWRGVTDGAHTYAATKSVERRGQEEESGEVLTCP